MSLIFVCTIMQILITVTVVCAVLFLLVFEQDQLFQFIDKSSCAGSKASQKGIVQTAIPVYA